MKAIPKPFFYAALFSFLFFFPSFGWANCYMDCMVRAGCWNSGDASQNQSFCSGSSASCSAECRNQKEEKSYGAIAYSAKDEGFGFSDGWKDRKKAEKIALDYCRKHGKKCEIEVWFYNSCGSVAADGKKVGWGRADSAQMAARAALEKCQKSGGKHCEVKTSRCSR